MTKALLCFTTLFLMAELSIAQSIETTNIKDWTRLPNGLHKTIDSAFESPSKKSTLTLRNFDVESDSLVKNKVNTWIKDYKSYGFNLKTQKPIKLENGVKGFFIEAFHKDFDQSFSQFVSVKNGKMTTLTCKSSDKAELKVCTDTILSFNWNGRTEKNL